jgi:glycosyltransferase involved in cell wall biosynthesis
MLGVMTIKAIYHHRTQATDAQGIHINEMYNAFLRLGIDMKMVALVKNEAVGQESRKGMTGKIISVLPSFIYELMEISFNFVGFFRLFAAVSQHKPQFIYERYSIYNIAGCLVSKLTNVPLIEEVNSPLTFEKKKYETLHFPKFAQMVENWVVNNAFKTIAVTRVLKEMLGQNGAHLEKIVVMSNGVNLEDYPLPTIDKSVMTPIVLGFIGWFRDWHGLEQVIETYTQHKWHKKNVEMLFVGDGPEKKNLENVILKNNLKKYVRITGAVDRKQLKNYLQRIDIAIQPAATEYASPMKLIEYMAAQKAIIAPDQANIRELLQDHFNAVLFRPGDWNDFSSKIEKLISDPSLINLLGRRARKTVEEIPLTWDHNARRVLRLIMQSLKITA